MVTRYSVGGSYCLSLCLLGRFDCFRFYYKLYVSEHLWAAVFFCALFLQIRVQEVCKDNFLVFDDFGEGVG